MLEECVGYNDPGFIMPQMLKYVKKDGLICDFGCGSGIIGKYLSKAGYTDFYGIDGS